MESPRSKLNFVRGFRAAGVGALVGAATPIVILVGLTVFRWWIWGAFAIDRRDDISWLMQALPYPLVGCATVLACAGWVTYAPRGAFRFASSLALIFFVNLPLWYGFGSLLITPRRSHSDPPASFSVEAIVIVVPPIAVAALVTLCRVRNQPALTPEEDFPSTPT